MRMRIWVDMVSPFNYYVGGRYAPDKLMGDWKSREPILCPTCWCIQSFIILTLIHFILVQGIRCRWWAIDLESEGNVSFDVIRIYLSCYSPVKSTSVRYRLVLYLIIPVNSQRPMSVFSPRKSLLYFPPLQQAKIS